MSADRSGARAGWVFAAVVLAWLLGSALLPAVPQPQSYHAFADARTIAGIANFWNVVSNAAILLACALGLCDLLAHPQRFLRRDESWPYAAFFGATVLIALGSTYYHLAPDDARLLWDRLPIALATAALGIAVWSDHSGSRTVVRLLWPALIAGALSVIYWRASARAGHDNLVPYLLLQLLAIGAVVLLTRLPGRYTRVADLWVVIGLYVAARLAEVFDRAIYALGGILSGHTLKHLLAALAAVWVLRMIRLRQPVSSGGDPERTTHA
jgi:hypothetical protein